MRVVDPERPAELHRHRPHPLPVARHQRQLAQQQPDDVAVGGRRGLRRRPPTPRASGCSRSPRRRSSHRGRSSGPRSAPSPPPVALLGPGTVTRRRVAAESYVCRRVAVTWRGAPRLPCPVGAQVIRPVGNSSPRGAGTATKARSTRPSERPHPGVTAGHAHLGGAEVATSSPYRRPGAVSRTSRRAASTRVPRGRGRRRRGSRRRPRRRARTSSSSRGSPAEDRDLRQIETARRRVAMTASVTASAVRSSCTITGHQAARAC